jgi:hypothetical protein
MISPSDKEEIFFVASSYSSFRLSSCIPFEAPRKPTWTDARQNLECQEEIFVFSTDGSAETKRAHQQCVLHGFGRREMVKFSGKWNTKREWRKKKRARARKIENIFIYVFFSRFLASVTRCLYTQKRNVNYLINKKNNKCEGKYKRDEEKVRQLGKSCNSFIKARRIELLWSI